MSWNREEIARKKRRRKKRRKVFFGVLLLIGLSALIVWKVFVVNDIIVEGNEHYSDKQIEQIIGEDEISFFGRGGGSVCGQYRSFFAESSYIKGSRI